MTRAETVTLLQTITVMYPASRIRADELTVGVWHEMLKDLPCEVVGVAVRRMCATLKFPPSIADIREAVTKAAQDARGTSTAGEAWARVRKAVSWYGYYRAEEARAWLGDEIWRAVEMVGGWREVCAGEDPEGVISAQFERRYNAMIHQQGEKIQIPESVRTDMSRLIGPMLEKMMIPGGA